MFVALPDVHPHAGDCSTWNNAAQGRAAFAEAYDISDQTMLKFNRYAALLVDWQARMNLVGASTLDTIWDRHFADSAQLVSLVASRDDTTWLDIGSGAGFPALVLALLVPGRFHLVEATAKKCRFLEAVVAHLGLEDRVTIHNDRIETMPTLAADVVTARACAALGQLIDWGCRHGRQATWLLLKGRTAANEVALARAKFDFTARLVPSRTDPDAQIVVAQHMRRR